MLALKFFLTGVIVLVLSAIFIHFTSEMKIKKEDIPIWAKIMAVVGFFGGLATMLVSLLVGIWTM